MLDLALIAAVIICAVLTVALSTRPVVTLSVRPAILISRGTITAEVHVPQDDANRSLTLEWAGDNGAAGRSAWPLDSDQVIFLRSIPDALPGNYGFLATVYGADDKVLGTATAAVHDPAGRVW